MTDWTGALEGEQDAIIALQRLMMAKRRKSSSPQMLREVTGLSTHPTNPG
jgi:hypothetical protein